MVATLSMPTSVINNLLQKDTDNFRWECWETTEPSLSWTGKKLIGKFWLHSQDKITVTCDDGHTSIREFYTSGNVYLFDQSGDTIKVSTSSQMNWLWWNGNNRTWSRGLPMPGTLLKVLAKKGDKVKKRFSIVHPGGNREDGALVQHNSRCGQSGDPEVRKAALLWRVMCLLWNSNDYLP